MRCQGMSGVVWKEQSIQGNDPEAEILEADVGGQSCMAGPGRGEGMGGREGTNLTLCPHHSRAC